MHEEPFVSRETLAPGDLGERFAARFKVNEETGCWEWWMARDLQGYGVVRCFRTGKVTKAHRLAMELAGFDLLSAETVDHVCCNKYCVNPAHLELVSQAENNRRKYERQRLNCFTGDN